MNPTKYIKPKLRDVTRVDKCNKVEIHDKLHAKTDVTLENVTTTEINKLEDRKETELFFCAIHEQREMFQCELSVAILGETPESKLKAMKESIKQKEDLETIINEWENFDFDLDDDLDWEDDLWDTLINNPDWEPALFSNEWESELKIFNDSYKYVPEDIQKLKPPDYKLYSKKITQTLRDSFEGLANAITIPNHRRKRRYRNKRRRKEDTGEKIHILKTKPRK